MIKESFWLTIKNYWHNGLDTAWTIYVPLIMLATFVLLSILINLVRRKSEKPVIIKALSSVYLAGIFTSVLGLLTTIWLMQFSTFFAHNFCQMGFLFAFLLIAIFTIIAFTKVCTLGKSKNSNALGMVVTPAEKQAKFTKFKKYGWFLWLWSLLLAAPFAILSIPNTSKHLISIVLDNSGSMDENLKQCTQALETALLPTRKYADYVFTTIDYTKEGKLVEKASEEVNTLIKKNKIKTEGEAWRQLAFLYYDDLVNQKSSRKVSTNTKVYTDMQSLFNSFAQMGLAENGSPVYEGIWQNYLESRSLAQGTQYVSKKMIVITDGADNLYSWLNLSTPKNAPFKLLEKDIFQQTGNIDEKADDFYNSICTINYGEYADDLLFKDCENSIDETYDGTDEQSYFDAFRSILPEMFFDILFLYILIGFAALLSLILLIIKTSTL